MKITQKKIKEIINKINNTPEEYNDIVERADFYREVFDNLDIDIYIDVQGSEDKYLVALLVINRNGKLYNIIYNYDVYAGKYMGEEKDIIISIVEIIKGYNECKKDFL